MPDLPVSVRYVKNGAGGRWWPDAKSRSRLHAGWSQIPDKALREIDIAAIAAILREQYGSKPGATQDLNALRTLLEGPSKQGADSEPNFAQRKPLLVSSSLCIVTICGGAAFIVATEEDADFVHGLYWAVVTMSTVGYGSATPQTDGATLTLTLILTLALSRYGSGTPETDGGRLFAAFYMLFGQG